MSEKLNSESKSGARATKVFRLYIIFLRYGCVLDELHLMWIGSCLYGYCKSAAIDGIDCVNTLVQVQPGKLFTSGTPVPKM